MVSKFSVKLYRYEQKHHYEQHTIEKVRYEDAEYLEEFHDEIRLSNISYIEIFDGIENNSIKIEELGDKM